jgi:hypothetical protein
LANDQIRLQHNAPAAPTGLPGNTFERELCTQGAEGFGDDDPGTAHPQVARAEISKGCEISDRCRKTDAPRFWFQPHGASSVGTTPVSSQQRRRYGQRSADSIGNKNIAR